MFWDPIFSPAESLGVSAQNGSGSFQEGFRRFHKVSGLGITENAWALFWGDSVLLAVPFFGGGGIPFSRCDHRKTVRLRASLEGSRIDPAAFQTGRLYFGPSGRFWGSQKTQQQGLFVMLRTERVRDSVINAPSPCCKQQHGLFPMLRTPPSTWL